MEYEVDITGLPDGHLKARIDEIEDCIRTDLTHIAYLKGELSRHWMELARREKSDV